MLRFDPFRELDRMAEQASRQARQARSVMAFDAVRNEDEVTMYFDVPGVRSADLELTVESNELTITAERKWNDEGKTVVSQERPQGTFSRRIALSDSLDGDRIEADLDHGVLIVKLPVKEATKPRSITIGRSGESEQIEATSSSGSEDGESSDSGNP